jgi:hypothetical protein
MILDEPKSATLSLGFLRKAEKTKPKSPNLTGTLKLQRHTIETFIKQFKKGDKAEIDYRIAAWRNVDANSQAYLTVELSPKYVARHPEGNVSRCNCQRCLDRADADRISFGGTYRSSEPPACRLPARYRAAAS